MTPLYYHLDHKVPNLSIKDVPEALAERLRQRAAKNHRSLQGELMAIVEAAAVARPTSANDNGIDFASYYDPRRRGAVVSVDTRGNPVIRRGTKTIQEIAATLRAQFPNPVNNGPSSVDIIRADRDAR